MKNLSSEQLVALATTTAIKIAKENDDDEVNIISDFFALISSALALIYDRNSLNSASDDSTKKT